MAFLPIAASETDADSPLNQTLADKLRLNQDGFNDGTAIGTDAITTDHIGADQIGQLEMASNSVGVAQLKLLDIEVGVTAGFGSSNPDSANINFGTGRPTSFFPRLKWVASGSPLGELHDNTVVNVFNQEFGASALSGSYKQVFGIYVEITNPGAQTAATVFAEMTYIISTPIRPMLWIVWDKMTHGIHYTQYHPECNDTIPFLPKTDKEELIAIQLDANPELVKHLKDKRIDANGKDWGMLEQLHLGILTQAIEIKTPVDIIYEKKDTPSLYSGVVKVLGFDFTKPEQGS